MLTVFLAKGITDFTFGGAFLWYLVKYVISAAVAFGGIMLGIRLRKRKNEKRVLAEKAGTETK